MASYYDEDYPNPCAQFADGRKAEAVRSEREVQEAARAYRQVEGLGERLKDRQRAIDALEAEVRRRNEYYGLDNWTFAEVVDFVLAHVQPRYEGD